MLRPMLKIPVLESVIRQREKPCRESGANLLGLSLVVRPGRFEFRPRDVLVPSDDQ